MQVGLFGVGKMGRLLADKWIIGGHHVIVYNRSKEALDRMRAERSQAIVNRQLVIASSVEELHDNMIKPRVYWTMLPAGEATEGFMQRILAICEPGDIVIDGGNANFKDTERWFAEFAKKQVRFLGVGVSGGLYAFANGFCLMVGGDKSAYEYCLPLFDTLIKPSGIHKYLGSGGAGHFAKMVHNGIEYGIMQALGEGFGVVAKSDYHFNLLDVAHTWQRGSIIQSFLLNIAVSALTKNPTLKEVEGIVDATGEAQWTIEEAKVKHLPINVIEQSLEFRKQSQYDKAVQETFAAKLVQSLRKEFGGHQLQKPEGQPPQQ